MRATSWEPAKTLVNDLSDRVTVDSLPGLASECQNLAARADCPCASTLVLVSSFLMAIHSRLDGEPLSQLQDVNLNELTNFLSGVIGRTSGTGDASEWRGLAEAWEALRNPPELH
jgi:hypothetical protein